MTIVLIGCLYLPRRLTAPAAPQGLKPAPAPVPEAASAIVISLPDSRAQGPQPASAPRSTRVAQLVPAPFALTPDHPTIEHAPPAPVNVQRAGTTGLSAESGLSTGRSPNLGAAELPGGAARIDPIYRFFPDAVSANAAESRMSLVPYEDALNPTLSNEFVSRPPMFGLNASQPQTLSTPVPYLSAVPRFVSRPAMGGLTLLRDEIDKARASLSFQVDIGQDTGLGPRSASGAGSLWPTFVPPHPVTGEHFWLEPPFPAGFNHLYSPGYQFGSTAGGRYRIHHGIDFGNPIGTPVLASASGEVIHAGPDNPALLGPYNDFYGNSVVIRLDRKLNTPRGEQDIFILYGHLSSVDVQQGQWVGAGDYLGSVGMTGIAIGPHLHLEVRLGQNSYLHTVNPAMWMRPAAYTGTVAVRLISASGRTWPNMQITLFRYEENSTRWYRIIETYPELESIGPNPSWGENGALTQVPAGYYHISAYVNGEEVSQDITVRDGETTFVELRTRQ